MTNETSPYLLSFNYCPEKSVQIKDIPGVKSYTKENGRYSHPYATVQDISIQKGE